MFQGRKKYFTVPTFVFLCLLFLPLTIIGGAAWFTKRKVKNSRVRKTLYAVLGVIALPFLASYVVAFTASPTSTSPEPIHTPVIQTTVPKDTPFPTVVAASQTPAATASIEAVMSTTIAKPTVKPTIAATATPRPTAKPTVAPTQTPAPAVVNRGGSACDCSRTCTEITSCAEAQYQLNTCGCNQRDADHDGIACDGAPLHCQN